jgi:hypothetical protein
MGLLTKALCGMGFHSVSENVPQRPDCFGRCVKIFSRISHKVLITVKVKEMIKQPCTPPQSKIVSEGVGKALHGDLA